MSSGHSFKKSEIKQLQIYGIFLRVLMHHLSLYQPDYTWNWWIQTPLLVLRWNWPCQKCLESCWLHWKTDSCVLYLQFKYVALSVWCLIASGGKQHARVDGKWGEAWISISHISVIKWLLQSWSALISCWPQWPHFDGTGLWDVLMDISRCT